MHHINRLKEKNQIIVLTDVYIYNVTEHLSNTFLKKKSYQAPSKFPSPDEEYNKSKMNILNGVRLEAFLLKLGAKQGCPWSLLLSQGPPGLPAHTVAREEKLQA